MFNQKELLAYLKANNIDTSNQGAVRRGLLSYEWSADDIETALVVLTAAGVFQLSPAEMPGVPSGLSAPAGPGPTQVQVAHTSANTTPNRGNKVVFDQRLIYSNQKLDASSIQNLLGVDVSFDTGSKEVRRVIRSPRMTFIDQIIAVTVALLLSAGILFGAMYHYKFGIFHHSSTLATYFFE